MAVASLVIAVAALVLGIRAALGARRARRSAEELLEQTLARTRMITHQD